MPNRKSLAQLAVERLKTTIPGPKFFEESIEIVVFGSMSVGLERPDSDIDILCVGKKDFKLKTDRLDLIVIPLEVRGSLLWRESELAGHILEYGTWIKGSCRWSRDVRIGHRAIEAKHRRIAAFVRALPDRWIMLDEAFRVKYSIKLKRETQRLILMERGVPVPPTTILDNFWESVSSSPHEVYNRLHRFTASSPSSFTKDLFARIGFGTAPHFKDPRPRPIHHSSCIRLS